MPYKEKVEILSRHFSVIQVLLARPETVRKSSLLRLLPLLLPLLPMRKRNYYPLTFTAMAAFAAFLFP